MANFLSKGPDEGLWTVPALLKWAKYLGVGEAGLVRGKGNKALKALAEAVKNGEKGLHTSRNVLQHILTEQAIERAVARDTKWLQDALKTSKRKTMEYPLRVLKKYGEDGILELPRIIIGTVHSVKGGEADCVCLFPDISLAARKEFMDSAEGKDALHRLFYVAMTRAREELVIMNPAPAQYGLFMEM